MRYGFECAVCRNYRLGSLTGTGLLLMCSCRQRFEQDMAQKASALGYKTPATASTAPVTNGKRPDETAKPVAPVALAPTKPLPSPRQQPVEKPVVESVDLLDLNSDKAPSPSPSPVKPVANAEQKAASPPKEKVASPPKPTELAASRASDPVPTEPSRSEPSPPTPEPSRSEPLPPKPASPAADKSPVVAPPAEALVVSAFTLTDSTADTADAADADDDNDDNDNDNDNDETEEQQQQQQATAAPKKPGKSKSKRKKKVRAQTAACG